MSFELQSRLIMSEKLSLNLYFGSRHTQYSLDYVMEGAEAKVEMRSILKAINKFIYTQSITICNYLNMWIITEHGKQSLFLMRKKGSCINLALGENSTFEIKIVLEDIEDKQNILKFFHSNSDQYTRLSNNINKIIEESREEEKKRGQQNIRPIDIAYFFADPLVTVSSRNKITTKHEVSYQLEYDRFIELVKKEEFGSNFRIEMMVATKTNIKNTLFECASILHFSCHGKKPKGNLQIESEASVGELVDLEHEQFMSLLDVRTALPKLIIFNVCFSSTLAQLVSASKRIITIGYDLEASDVYCEEFTREFYMGLFKHRQPVRQLFHRIKAQIIEKNEEEGRKLRIFPEQPFPDEDIQDFFGSTVAKLNFVKKWTLSENMRENDSLGVKYEMFTFIKQFLTNGERMSYLFLRGEKHSGKSDFMKKTRIYIMNRKVFTEEVTIDLKGKDGSCIENMLQLRLEKEDTITRKLAELRELAKERRTNPLIIFDHTEAVLKVEYARFIDLLHARFLKELKYGKVVVITNNITPISREDAERFRKAQAHVKEAPNIEDTEIFNYIKRYASEDIKDSALKYYNGRLYPFLKLIKAIKKSKSEQELSDHCESDEPAPPRALDSVSLDYIEDHLRQFEVELRQLQECAVIRVEDNDYILLSTILGEVDLETEQHYTSLSCSPGVAREVEELSERFNCFVQSVFRAFRRQEEELREVRGRVPMALLLHVSLKIAAFIYLYKDFRLFEKHLLKCETLHVLVSGFCLEGKQGSLHDLLAHYHLKLLLTLYSYYSQNQHALKHRELALRDSQNKEEKENEALFKRKAEIIVDEITAQFDRNDDSLLTALRALFVLNDIAQELHYNKAYSLFVQNERQTRRESEVFELSNEEGGEVEEQAAAVDQHHKKVVAYWKAFRELERQARGQGVLREEGLAVAEVVAVKLVVFNVRQFEAILERGESFLSETISLYIDFYLQIMQKIRTDGVFGEGGRHGVFRPRPGEAMKGVFQEYLKAFVETYFGLERVRQNLSKEYSLPIFLELGRLCQQAQYVSGMSSIKKMIELHISEQFFNTWTCSALVALPLLYEQGGEDVKYNIKRYEAHLLSFLLNFYNHDLDKELRFEFRLLNEDVLKEERRRLIELVVCDCKEDSEKVYLESETGQSTPTSLRSLRLPSSPVVIFFGVNVRVFEEYYNHSESVAIWINMERKGKGEEESFEKEKTLACIEAYNNRLGIYYNVLEFFYCSFCRHFFNGTHSLFKEQVKNSFDLAKAETIIKTKILYSTSREFHSEKEIQAAIDSIDSNLQYLLGSHYGQHLAKQPAYHFIYKQNASELKGPRHVPFRTWEIGCNFQVSRFLGELGELRDEREANWVIYYKSDPMLSFFLSTLRVKLIKIGKYTLKPQIPAAGYQQYRSAIDQRIASSSVTEVNHIAEEELPFIIPFVNLEERQVKEEVRALNISDKTMVRLFFTRKPYSDLPTHKKLEIEQGYKKMKTEFEYYFLYCKTLKPNANERKLLQIFKEVAGQPSASLQSLKSAIQK